MIKKWQYLLLVPVFWAAGSLGARAASADSYSVAKDALATGNQYVDASTVTIDGTVQGDLVVAATTVTIRGTVTGSLLGYAGTVDIDGKVGGSVRTAGQSLSIRGTVGGDVTAVQISLLVAKEAHVGGSLFYLANDESIARSAIAGSSEGRLLSTLADSSPTEQLANVLRSFLMLGLLGVVVLSWQNQPETEGAWDRLRLSFPLAFGIGVLVVLFGMPVVALLMLSIVGRWLGLLFLAGLTALFILSLVDAAYFLGHLILSRRTVPASRTISVYVFGLLITVVLATLPVLWLIPVCVGIGAVGVRTLTQIEAFRERKSAGH